MKMTNLICLLGETHVDDLLMPYREPVVESSGIPIHWWVLGAFAFLGAALFIFHLINKNSEVVTPDGLLKELCYAHRIGITERQLLGLVAEKAGIKNAASMFVTLTNFDNAVSKASESKKFNRREQSMLKTVRSQIFSLGY